MDSAPLDSRVPDSVALDSIALDSAVMDSATMDFLLATLADEANVWSLHVRRLRDLLDVLEEIGTECPDSFSDREAAGG